MGMMKMVRWLDTVVGSSLGLGKIAIAIGGAATLLWSARRALECGRMRLTTGECNRRRIKVLFYDRASRLAPSVTTAMDEALSQCCEIVTWHAADRSNEDNLLELISSSDVIVSGPPGPPPNMLQSAAHLKLLQTTTAGHEWVPWASLPPSCCVCNTSSMDTAIAEYVMLAILEHQLQVCRADAEFREKQTFVPPFGIPGLPPMVAPFHAEAAGKTIGIVGLGNIGEQVARRAAAFDMRVLATTNRSRPASEPLPAGVSWRGSGTGADLEHLLRESDFVVLCCALAESSRGMINAARLGLLKLHAVLINIGRGPLCDETALYEALRDRRIGGAVLDVWWQYPTAEQPERWPSRHPFHELDNVVMTPHLSGWSREQEARKAAQMAANFGAVAEGRTPGFLLGVGQQEPVASAAGSSSSAGLSLLVGQYNLLCPTYGVKWGEREACEGWVSKSEHGGSNWARRWPALKRVLHCARWDVLTLEELEGSTRADVTQALGAIGMALVWFDHPGRADALGIAYNTEAFTLLAESTRHYPLDNPKSTSGRVDLSHTPSGRVVRVVVTHQKGGIAAQLDDLFAFADAGARDECVTIINGDFNEDFGDRAASIRPGYTTLRRGADELAVSRPPHKQGDGQASGKGLVDYIFVKNCGMGTCALGRDEASRRALAMSHAACDETGEWPSDHGLEALTLTVGASDGGKQ